MISQAAPFDPSSNQAPGPQNRTLLLSITYLWKMGWKRLIFVLKTFFFFSDCHHAGVTFLPHRGFTTSLSQLRTTIISSPGLEFWYSLYPHVRLRVYVSSAKMEYIFIYTPIYQKVYIIHLLKLHTNSCFTYVFYIL